MKIHWKLIIFQNLRVVFQISRPGNIPQKWFSTQNEPLGVTFQMGLTPTSEASNFWRNQAKSTMHPFKNTFEGCTMLSVWFFRKWKVPMVWAQSHLERDTQRFVLSTEPFFKDICRPRYLNKHKFVQKWWLRKSYSYFHQVQALIYS